MAIVVNIAPYRAAQIFGAGIRYLLSAYLILVVLIAAIVSLLPAVKLRMRTLRMQVSDDGPYLGATRLGIEPDGLTIDRSVMKAKYFWAAFQGVEIVKNAIILPIDNGIGLIIPVSAFASDAARYEFAATISKRLEQKSESAPRYRMPRAAGTPGTISVTGLLLQTTARRPRHAIHRYSYGDSNHPGYAGCICSGCLQRGTRPAAQGHPQQSGRLVQRTRAGNAPGRS